MPNAGQRSTSPFTQRRDRTGLTHGSRGSRACTLGGVVELPRRLRRPRRSGHPPGCSPFDKYETEVHNDGHGCDHEEGGVDLVHVE